MAIELMLLAVNMNFVAFSHYLGDTGQIFVFFILTVAAAESAIGLAILVCCSVISTRSTSKTSISSRADGNAVMSTTSSLKTCCWRSAGAAGRLADCGAVPGRSGAQGRTSVTILGVLAFILSAMVFFGGDGRRASTDRLMDDVGTLKMRSASWSTR
jgi:hypothetical protein